MDISAIVEALIFAAPEPVTAGHILEVIRRGGRSDSLTEADVEAIITALNEAYAREGRAFRIHAWAGGYRMATVPEAAPYLEAFFKRREVRRLSRSLLETLAVVAYRQPVTKPEVDFIRGVDAGYALGKLLEMGYIEVSGRAEQVGRPLQYRTTDRFLEAFGLRSLEELPRPREIEELLADPAYHRERARLLSFQSVEQQRAEDEAT